MLRYWFLIVIACSSFKYIRGQQISGQVVDSLNTPILQAHIKLFEAKSEELIDFTFTDTKGLFSLKLHAPQSNYFLTISHLGYRSKTISISGDATNTTPILVALAVKEEKLNEVEVFAIDYGVRLTEEKDSIFYDLKKFTTGTESTLGDVLEKLPGVSVTTSGKIIFNNKKIDQLLIEDQEFFGGMHQLATQNISAHMINDVQVYRNYKPFGSLDSGEETKLTALNVKIKDEFKNRYSGNVLLDGGFNNKYLAHLNAFNFKKGLRLNLISDWNNKGKQSISSEDYMEMHLQNLEANKQDQTTVSYIDDSEIIPEFLQTQENVYQNEAAFTGVNINWPIGKKIQLDSYSFINWNKQKGRQTILQNYAIESSRVKLQNEENFRNRTFVNQTQMKLVYAPNSKSVVKYYLNFRPQDNTLLTTIQNISENQTTTLNELKKNKSGLFQNMLLHETFISEGTRWKNSIHYDIAGIKNPLNIIADYSFLTDLIQDPIQSFEQSYCLNQRNLKMKSNFFMKKNEKEHFNLLFGGDFGAVKLESLTTFKKSENQFNNRLNLFQNNYHFSGTYSYRSKEWFRFTSGFTVQLLDSKYNNQDQQKIVILPTVSLTSFFDSLHELRLFFNQQVKLPSIVNLNDSPIIESFQSVKIDSKTRFNNLNELNTFGITYKNFDIGKKIIFWNLTYKHEKNVIGADVSYSRGNQFIRDQVLPYRKTWNSILLLETRLSKYSPFRFGFDTTYLKQDQEIILNDRAQDRIFNQWKASFIFRSNFLTKAINFHFKGIFKSFDITFKDFAATTKMKQFSYVLGIKGRHHQNRLKWRSSLTFLNTNTSENENYYQSLNLYIEYKKKGSHFQVALEANDLLNLKSNEFIESNQETLYFEEKSFYRFPGFLTLNVTHQF